MFETCLICRRSKSFPLAHCLICRMCMNGLSPVNQHRFAHCLYEYNGAMRDLILRVKIAGELPVLRSLLSVVKASSKVATLVPACHRVVPAPSSLWGRFRGQTDLAWFLAKEISLTYGLSFENPPFKLLWRVKKRARTLNKKIALPKKSYDKQKKETLLIVDDVITTGDTMTRLSAIYNKAYHVEFFSLASASKLF